MSASTSRSPACSPRAWSCTRPIARPTANGSMPAEVTIEGDGDARRATLIATGEPVEIGPIEKMSKSKKNTVDPDDIIGSYGADTARWFMLSDSPPERDVIWTEEGVAGRLALRAAAVAAGRAKRADVRGKRRAAAAGARSATPALALRKAAHRALARGVGGHRAAALQRRASPTSTSSPTRFQASLAQTSRPSRRADYRWALREAVEILVRLFPPMMPHLAEECWAALGHKTLVADASPGRSSSRPCWSRTRSPCRSRSTARSAPMSQSPATPSNAEIETAVLALDAVQARARRQAAEEGDRGAAEDRECGGITGSGSRRSGSRTAVAALAIAALAGRLLPAALRRPLADRRRRFCATSSARSTSCRSTPPKATDEARLAVEIRNALLFDFTGGGIAASPTHRLKISISSTAHVDHRRHPDRRGRTSRTTASTRPIP